MNVTINSSESNAITTVLDKTKNIGWSSNHQPALEVNNKFSYGNISGDGNRIGVKIGIGNNTVNVYGGESITGDGASKSLVLGSQDPINEVIKLPFSLGIDSSGNYGYIKAGADTVTPFKSGVKGILPYGFQPSRETYSISSKTFGEVIADGTNYDYIYALLLIPTYVTSSEQIILVGNSETAPNLINPPSKFVKIRDDIITSGLTGTYGLNYYGESISSGTHSPHCAYARTSKYILHGWIILTQGTERNIYEWYPI